MKRIKGFYLTRAGKFLPVVLFVLVFSGIGIYNYVMNPVRALQNAFEKMDIEQLDWAIQQGVNVDTFIQNIRPISLAFAKKRYDFMESLAKAGATLDLNTANNTSFVGRVLMSGDTTALNILGRYGANFHKKVDTLGRNAITYVIAEGKNELISTVLKYTQRNKLDAAGNAPLHYANNTDDETIKYLIKKGADPNVRDRKGNTPLHKLKNLRAISTLHKLGADINAANNCGTPPIFHQVGNGNGRAYQYMNENGANIGIIDGYGQGIITYALMTENELLHRRVDDNFCEYYPDLCEQQKERLKSTGKKALATLIYTKTLHQAALRRLAASQAAKRAAGKVVKKAALKRIGLKAIPLVGWGSAAYDAYKFSEAMGEHNSIIQEHRAEAKRLKTERLEAQKQLRAEYLNCETTPIVHTEQPILAKVKTNS